MRHKLIILLAGIAGLAGLVLAPAAGGAAAKDKGGNAPVRRWTKPQSPCCRTAISLVISCAERGGRR